jgi:hypothetical protein
VWHTDKLVRVLAAFRTSLNVVLVAHHSEVVNSEGLPVGRSFPRPTLAGYYELGSLPLAQYPGFTITVRRWVLEVADPDTRPDLGDVRSGLMAHDSWVWMLASCVGDSLIISDRLVSYRQHENLFGDRHPSLSDRIRSALNTSSATYVNATARELLVARYLDGLGKRWLAASRPAWTSGAQVMADRYQERASFVCARAKLYHAPNRRSAAVEMIRMLRSGKYVTESHTAWRSILKDAVRVQIGMPREGPV